jgi:hypothetical protein
MLHGQTDALPFSRAFDCRNLTSSTTLASLANAAGISAFQQEIKTRRNMRQCRLQRD